MFKWLIDPDRVSRSQVHDTPISNIGKTLVA
jgi:hypothetical protein